MKELDNRKLENKGYTVWGGEEGPHWPSGLANLASDHRLSPLCGFDSHSLKCQC